MLCAKCSASCFKDFFFFFFLGLHLRDREVPRRGVKSQLPAYTTATTIRDPSHLCDLHHSSRQRQILNPMSKARDQIHILTDASQICFHWATMGSPRRRHLKGHLNDKNARLACLPDLTSSSWRVQPSLIQLQDLPQDKAQETLMT